MNGRGLSARGEQMTQFIRLKIPEVQFDIHSRPLQQSARSSSCWIYKYMEIQIDNSYKNNQSHYTLYPIRPATYIY